MVLFKRKPVQYLPPAEVEDEDAEVWYIPQTGEIFASYEEYLNRYLAFTPSAVAQRRRFNDEITGHSGLTFFEAYTSERAGGQEVEAAFPEALKGPILRKVQFQTISRLDNLVDMVYDEFKADFYPGEDVFVTLDEFNNERRACLVREKTTFGARILPDGSSSLPTSRYLVVLGGGSGKEQIVTNDSLSRERGAFTKSMLRSFIKRTVIREAWNGAPWLVKSDYASQYHIDTRIPPHLRHDTKIQERKQLLAQKRERNSLHEANGHGPTVQTGPVRLPELKPAPKSHKGKQTPNSAGGKGLKWPLDMAPDGVNGAGYPPYDEEHTAVPREPTPPPPPPPPKYPIEDLQLEPKEGNVRPPLKFMCKDPPVKVEVDDAIYGQIDMETVGPLLETWDTLNVYCEIFKLDSFTFDDFVEALSVASNNTQVQLIDEIHCSVLKILVDAEADGGKVRITLPEIEEEDSDEDEDDEDEDGEESGEESAEPEDIPVARATRSSLAKLEAERLAAEAAAAEEESLRAELETKNRAEELLKEFDWVEHLRQRNFQSGGWQRILVGLLHQLSKNERQQQACEELLQQLVPADMVPSPENVQQQYAELDINHRVKALQIICMLTMETKAVRGYMEDCSETMTKYRKDKIEWQRQRKQATEELRQLNEQRKLLMPENEPSEETNGTPIKEEIDVKMVDADESIVSRDDEAEDSQDESSRKKRRSRVLTDKKKKHEEEEKLKKAKEKALEKAKPQQSKQYIKLLKDIQKKEEIIKKCEEEVAIIENDLREADCPRTRVLGKDRFWNRYYWFERNGMPYAGLPDSSTAHAGYANGCIWVQGPDDLEREGYLELPADLQNEYKAKFNVTVLERKAMEEGESSVFTAKQWGYISEPEDLDRLIKWLDPRGFNELKLRKELVAYRDRIAAHMENRKKYLAGDADEDEGDKKEEPKRTSSRIREKTPDPPGYRCLQWENTMALEELGHLHGDPPPPPRSRKQTKKREAMTEAAPRPATKTRRK
ncbi:ddt domain-containing [Trichoderma arundinaceum]|uniref:Ddt domain-containing n=1 Tax=Trichoderma arundinaceum TaxID=490622 RepID=A0A395NIF0_TRIAR|nr:ddt domain-containing [Trichoderma arundinaceum]